MQCSRYSSDRRQPRPDRSAAPVVEPPAGSRLMANTAPESILALIASPTGSLALAPAGMTPSDTGACWPSITHSSKSRPCARLACHVRQADIVGAFVVDREVMDVAALAASEATSRCCGASTAAG